MTKLEATVEIVKAAIGNSGISTVFNSHNHPESAASIKKDICEFIEAVYTKISQLENNKDSGVKAVNF